MVYSKWLGMTALSIVLLSSGCSNESGNKDSQENVNTTTNQDPIELVFYYPFPQDWNEETFMKTFGEPIRKKFPHITVKYMTDGKGTSVPELITSGQKIDVIFSSLGATPDKVLDFDLQYDITPLIKKYNFDLNSLDPAMIQTQKMLAGGAIYGLPIYAPPSTLYYNKELFDKFGVSYPKDGMTWDDLYELNKKLTASNITASAPPMRTQRS